ncbi:MAG: 50S ribosomal protein L4 [Clostridiales bacterium]|nr:50S ribosomal protein L4 [Clostridiales bacterium]
MKIDVFDMNGKKLKPIELSEAVFGQEYNEALIHQVVVAQLANKRQGTKSTLTRTEVSGGGKKPWRQKGTGRARQGSIRSPQWVGGGVVFAPKPRDFEQKINKKMKIAATISALSAKVSTSNLVVVDKIELAEAKTKLIANMLNSLNIDSKVLVVMDKDDEAVLRACKNLQNVTVINADLINVYDLAANTKCIATVDAIKKLEEVYA